MKPVLRSCGVMFLLAAGIFVGGIGGGIGSAIVVCFMTWALQWDCRRYRSEQSIRMMAVYQSSVISHVKSLSRVGLPIGVAIFFEVSLFTVIALFLTDLGPVVVAGHQVALNVSSVTFMLPLSLGMALTVRVGHYIGEQNRESVNSLNPARQCA